MGQPNPVYVMTHVSFGNPSRPKLNFDDILAHLFCMISQTETEAPAFATTPQKIE